MLPVAGDERQVVFDRGRGDQRVRSRDACLAANAAGALRDAAVHRQFAKRIQKSLDKRRSDVAGKQLAASDDRVVDPVPAGLELAGAAQMVDEDVRVDQEVSHRIARGASACQLVLATRHDREIARPAQPRKCSRAP